MARAPTAKRYAQAAFQIAQERDEIDQWLEELGSALAVVEDAAFRPYLEFPKVAIEDKVRAIQRTLEGVNPLVQNLVALLVSRNTLELYPSIVAEYQGLVDKQHGRERAVVVTAVPLDDQQQSRVRQQLSKLLGKEVVLSTRVEPKVLGGLVARMGDRLIDGSMRGRLTGLRDSLLKSLG
jgi:F-type H+-transporting ATPase subunit delta